MAISRAKRRRIFRRDRHTCRYCGRPATLLLPGEFLTIDHVVPRARGGTDDDCNLAAACNACNARRADHDGSPGRPLLAP